MDGRVFIPRSQSTNGNPNRNPDNTKNKFTPTQPVLAMYVNSS